MPEGKNCAVDITVSVVGGRWKVLILQCLFKGTQRFSELSRAIEGITQKMLTQQLRELEADGIVSRQVFATVPTRVEYSLTALGRSLWPVLQAMHEWGLKQLAAHQATQASNDGGAEVKH